MSDWCAECGGVVRNWTKDKYQRTIMERDEWLPGEGKPRWPHEGNRGWICLRCGVAISDEDAPREMGAEMTSYDPPTSPPQPSMTGIRDRLEDATNALCEIAAIAATHADGASDSGQALEWMTVLELCVRNGAEV